MTVLLKGKLYPFSSFYIKAGEGGTPTTSVVEYYTEGTIPFIKIEDLSCKYLTNNKDFITELGMQKSSAWLIPSKSVIYQCRVFVFADVFFLLLKRNKQNYYRGNNENCIS